MHQMQKETICQMNTKTFSEVQEIKISGSLGWKRVSGSGARSCLPGDVEGMEWLGECKTHVKRIPQVVFQYDHWKKICEEATSKFKRPVLFVDDGSQLLEYTWCLIPAFDHEGTAVEIPHIHNFSIRRNLSFIANCVRRYLHDYNDSNNWEYNYIDLVWHGEHCHLLRFSHFAQLFGEQQ